MSQHMSLGQLLQFLQQPQSRAAPVNIPSVPKFGSSKSKGNKYERELLAKDQLKRKNAARTASFARDVYGDRKGDKIPYDQSAEMFPGEEPISGLNNIAHENTKIYDESQPFQRRLMNMNRDMLSTGDPTMVDQWQKNQGNMQGSLLSSIAAMDRSKQKSADSASAAMNLYDHKVDNPQMGTYGRNSTDAGLVRGTQPFQEDIKRQMAKTDMFEAQGKKAMNADELKKWMNKDGTPLNYGNLDMAKNGDIVPRSVMDPGKAGKLSSVEEAIAAFPMIDKYMFNKDGTINEGVVKDMWVNKLVKGMPDIMQTLAEPLTNKMLSPAGQAVSTAYELGIQAITRAETGAEMPPSEINNTRARFQPSVNEDSRVSAWKSSIYQNLLRNIKKYLDPIKQANPEASRYELINKAIDKAFLDNPLDQFIEEYATKLKGIQSNKIKTPLKPGVKVTPDTYFRIGDIITNPNGPEKARFTGKGDPNDLIGDDANWEEF